MHVRPIIAVFASAALIGACTVDAVTPDDPATSAGGGSTTAGPAGVGGAGVGGGGQGGEEIIVINEGFIGGPCETNADCDYDGGFCLEDVDGFPDGMCSLDCSQFCPDQDGAVTTFCAIPEELGADAAEGLCTARCDFGQSPTGCRTGYHCEQLTRYGDPDVEVFACVPGEGGGHTLSACEQELAALGVAFSPAVNPMDSPDGLPNVVCDIDTPIWVSGSINGVDFHPSSPGNDPNPMFVACPLALALVKTADTMTSMGLTDLTHYGTYNCRVISGTSTLSQHGLANAIDIAGVSTSEGTYYGVFEDWEDGVASPVTPAGQSLKTLVETLHEDKTFNIILTPEYNAAHDDHFHVDLTPGSDFIE